MQRSMQDAVDAVLEAGEVGPAPVWATFTGRRGDLSGMVLVGSGPGSDPWGRTAPEEVWALGMLAGATARDVCTGQVLHRGRICVVVARDGAVGASLEGPGGEIVRDPPEEGRVLDVMQRFLGVPTAPPPLPADAAMGLVWLSDIATAGAWVPAGSLPWAFVAALHPAWSDTEALLDPAPAGIDPRAGEAAALRRTAASWDWEEVRRRCASGQLELPGVDPDVAGWMDAGMLCRSMVDRLGPLGAILEGARTVADPEDWGRIMLVASATPTAACRTRGRRRPR